MPPAQSADAASDEAADAHQRLLLVALQESAVALPAEAVLEVLPGRPYARLPGADASVAGLVNRRGRMLTVVDLGAALGQDRTAEDPDHRVVVVGWHDRQIGLAVKDVLQITTAWWTDGPDLDGKTETEAGEPGSLADQEDPEADQQLQVIELEALLAPLFGGSDGDDDATETERK